MKGKRADNCWFIDKDTRYRWIFHKVKKRLISCNTPIQRVEIIDTYQFGRVVILDDKIQSTETDEYIYHEALVHPVMITHPKPGRVLILGGGEGATLREVLKYMTVEKVTMIDIDKEFVTICRKYLKKWHKGSFNDPRVEVVFTDALIYLKAIQSRFDVIIADISDPVEKGPAISMYTKKFYSLIKKALMPDGIFVTHADAIHYANDENISIGLFKTLNKMFSEAVLYYEYIPSYGTLWSFAACSFKYSPKILSSGVINKRLKERRIDDLSYYNPETHEKLFRMPKCIKRLLGTGK